MNEIQNPGTTAVEITAEMTPADMQAALKFMRKRVRRHGDAPDGMSAALFAVMLVSGKAMVESDLPLSAVESILDQFKVQICQTLRNGGAE